MMNPIKKCVLIIPYFGKFNNYFPLFLKSCQANSMYEWIIFTDCKDEYDYPENVHVIYTTLKKIKNIAERKLGFSISMETPYKLCDYKPSYGFLFEEYIQDYEYWGHCDCDLIFGNLNEILTPLLDKGYGKIFAAGHLTIYKNTFENNRLFMKPYKGKEIYKEAFTTDKIYVFDEDCIGDKNPEGKNIHAIFLSEKTRIYAKDLSMNASTTSGVFVNEYYDDKNRFFVKEQYRPKRYYWNNGDLFSVGWDSDTKNIIMQNFIYMHLQMRKMRMKDNVVKSSCFQILPDRFVPEKNIPIEKKELKFISIRRTYFYWIDVFKRKLENKYKKVRKKRE